MEIKILPITEVTPYYNNPRDNDKAVSPVAESIKRYGFIKPILIDENNVIICGHTRYYASIQLGFSDVPVIYSDLSEEQKRLFRIADNKLAEGSFYNEYELKEELSKLSVPKDMQPFFSESIEDLIDTGYSEMTSSFEPVDFSSFDDDEYEDEGLEERSESHDLYVPFKEDGVTKMRIFCPYCSNVDTIIFE